MSQYLEIKVKVTDKSAALQALAKLGLRAQVDDNGKLKLTDYWGKVRPHDCHITVSRDQLGNCTNDFGINLDTGEVWIDDYAMRQKAGKFLQEYAVAVAAQTYMDQGDYVERIDDPATGKVHLFVRGA